VPFLKNTQTQTAVVPSRTARPYGLAGLRRHLMNRCADLDVARPTLCVSLLHEAVVRSDHEFLLRRRSDGAVCSQRCTPC
jgi:hypothetical protein